jgi:glycosyltransferase involved in cell wall biosynthesis
LTANYYGITHEARWIDESEFHTDLEKILAAMDQPTINGVNTYLVSKAAAARGMKIALSGLGGDELFGGYPSFRQVPRIAALLPASRSFHAVGRAFRRMMAGTLGILTSPKWAGLLEYGGSYSGAYLLRRALYMPWELEGVLDPAMVKVGLEELQPLLQLEQTASGLHGSRQRVAALEIEWYMRNQLLRDADWAGMAHSLEIRVPLVDVELFRRIAPLLATRNPPSKLDAARALIKPLPESVINRPKTGFATPVRDWISRGTDNTGRTRGLRGWASRVCPPAPRKFRALVLVTDAFGGQGGIAKFNRDFLTALCRMSECEGVVAVPRLIVAPIEPLPIKLTFLTRAAAGKLSYVWTVLRVVLQNRFDLVVAGHINLLPLAAIISRCTRARLLLVIHGIDAWTRHSNFLVRGSISSVSTLVAVSQLTLDRFRSWAAVEPEKCHILPNCVEMTRYGPGPKSQALAERLGILGRPVIMTAGRLSQRERYKGFDAVIDALPELIKKVPDLVYLICGVGDDRRRLEAKVEALGMGRHVTFAGFVPEEEKADYFHLADAYVMPSYGEGFGIVFLEAMACGVPVMGSKTDGSREALMSGELGLLVDPENEQEIVEGVLETLKRPNEIPLKLQYFSKENFERRVADLVRQVAQSRT